MRAMNSMGDEWNGRSTVEVIASEGDRPMESDQVWTINSMGDRWYG